MRKGERRVVAINLETVDELFLVPNFNPFDPKSRYQSGIDELIALVRKQSFRQPLKIYINIQSRPNDNEFKSEIKNALSRYCSVKISECEQEIQQIKSQGRRDLVWAFTLSFGFLLGAFFTSQLSILPELIIYLISTGLGILAWVVLWPPLDGLLYEWRPCRRSQRIYQRIQAADVEINTT